MTVLLDWKTTSPVDRSSWPILRILCLVFGRQLQQIDPRSAQPTYLFPKHLENPASIEFHGCLEKLMKNSKLVTEPKIWFKLFSKERYDTIPKSQNHKIFVYKKRR